MIPNLKLRIFFALLSSLFFSSYTFSQCDAAYAELSGTSVAFSQNDVIVSPVSQLDAQVPAGFKSIYLLSKGEERVVSQFQSAPSFSVEPIGQYGIHSFVFDSLQFNLEDIIVDTTSIIGLFNHPDLGGSASSCFALDTTGVIVVFEMPTDSCEASVGTLLPFEEQCLSDGTKSIEAIHGIDPVVPATHEIAYILLEEGDSTVSGVSARPFFIVEGDEPLSIFTLVYDTAAYSLDSIQLGSTNLQEIASRFPQAGGEVCGALDTIGVSIDLPTCGCAAAVGSLVAKEACLDGAQVARVEAEITEPSNVPEDYQVVYFLSTVDDGIIRSIADSPSFLVGAAGEYAIHTFVYNPGSFPIFFVRTGATTIDFIDGFLIQSGGFICASLDVEGAKVSLLNCLIGEVPAMVFPNPANESISIQLGDRNIQGALLVEMVDILGRPVKQLQWEGINKFIRMDVSDLTNGTYWLKLSNNVGNQLIESQIIMIQH